MVYSGGEPQGDRAFAELARRGIKTVVSADGARPDIEAAHRHGLRYVHIPIGYDGVDAQAGATLAQLVQTGTGPYFIHCHHGQHRGPAAAAVACLAAGSIDHQQAVKFLQDVGTSRDYAGLWRDVEAYRPPPAEAELPPLRETVQVSSLVAAMAQIDRSFDLLKECRKADWQTPEKHPDVVPHREALLIVEAFREAARNLTPDHDARFRGWLTDAERLATELKESLMAPDLKSENCEQAWQRLEYACKQCHQAYRN